MRRARGLAGLAVLMAPLAAQEPVWDTAAWDAASLGNHRAVVVAEVAGDAVRVPIAWRRRDPHPEQRDLIVVAAATGARVANVARIDIGQEQGEIAFEPIAGPGEYDVYYLPFTSTGRRNYPTVSYPASTATAGGDWLARNDLAPAAIPGGAWRRLPEARVAAIQAVDPFDSYAPMEVIASRQEVQALFARHPGSPYLLFPEDRTRSIRMDDALPQRWAQAAANGPMGSVMTSFSVPVHPVRTTAPIAIKLR